MKNNKRNPRVGKEILRVKKLKIEMDKIISHNPENVTHEEIKKVINIFLKK